MKFFSRQELIQIGIVLSLLIFVSLANFQVSLRRSRDSQRKNDLGSVVGALDRYFKDFGGFPLSSEDGRIIACLREGENLSPCEWGKDGIRDVSDPSYPPYLVNLPQDPHHDQGLKYFYIANSSRFQIYASLEGRSEPEYDQKIIERNIMCGTKICNFGRATGKTPLDKSIEEYENKLYAH